MEWNSEMRKYGQISTGLATELICPMITVQLYPSAHLENELEVFNCHLLAPGMVSCELSGLEYVDNKLLRCVLQFSEGADCHFKAGLMSFISIFLAIIVVLTYFIIKKRSHECLEFWSVDAYAYVHGVPASTCDSCSCFSALRVPVMLLCFASAFRRKRLIRGSW